MRKESRLNEALTEESIEIIGAREHNLKNINLVLPKNKLIVFTGVSGSGKSSLAFDTIYNEGQRRYMESFSAYARQFMGHMERPDVDYIGGLSPVISIEQKTTNKNPRSTVGTITEIYDFLRLLYARIAEAYSYATGKKMIKMSEEEIVNTIFEKYANQKITILAPLVRGRKGHYRELFQEILKKGYLKVRVDGEIKDITARMQLDRYKIHDIEIVVDRLTVTPAMKLRIHDDVQKALQMGKDFMMVEVSHASKPVLYARYLMCEDTGISYEEPSPNTFSFNSPYGACPHCKGLGVIYTIDMKAVIPDANKSVQQGGIVPLGEERATYMFQKVKQLAQKHKISLSKPIKQLSEEQLNILLYGNEKVNKAETDIAVDDMNDETDNSKEFEGIVLMLERWFRSAKSTEGIREWVEKFMHLQLCPECKGTRLKKESLWFKIDGKNIAELSEINIDKLLQWFQNIEKRLNAKQNIIAKDILKEIRSRLQFLIDVGLSYLSLNRSAYTLSGGESQRIRLATQIGSQLEGITYILDEPSIGLHQRDNHRLITSLQHIKNMRNTVLVVEHDRDIMLSADYLVDIGPGAGRHGGYIVASGTPKEVAQSHSETAQYLSHKKHIPIPAVRRKGNGKYIELTEANGNNLKNISVLFPLGKLIVVTGVSGSGKSTLINETLYPLLMQHCYHTKTQPLPFKTIKGIEHIDKVIEINQQPIGRTPRSNPATYCGFFTDIRQLFASVPESKIRGYTPGRFSFNVKGGRCEVCQGSGMRVIEMNFLPDVYVPCEQCSGRRYNRETLEIRYKGKSISDVLDMTVDEAIDFFQPIPSLHRKIKMLQEVGLGYIALGQSAVTLSGGEAQRIKLSTELSKKDTGNTFYILDEPTTGLHFQDIQLLLDVLNKLVDKGNTVLIIEHNMDVIKTADYLIDIGPEGGDGGGSIVFAGTPEEMIEQSNSYTAFYLKKEMNA